MGKRKSARWQQFNGPVERRLAGSSGELWRIADADNDKPRNPDLYPKKGTQRTRRKARRPWVPGARFQR